MADPQECPLSDHAAALISLLRLDPVLGGAGEVFQLAYPSLRLRLAPYERWPLRVEHPTATLSFEMVPDGPLARAAGYRESSGRLVHGDLTQAGPILDSHPRLLESLLASGAVISGSGVRWRSVPEPALVQHAASLVTLLLHQHAGDDAPGRWHADLERERLRSSPVRDLRSVLLICGRPRPAEPSHLLRLRPLVSDAQARAWLPELMHSIRDADQLDSVEQLMDWDDDVVDAVLAKVDRWPHRARLTIASSETVFRARPGWCLSSVLRTPPLTDYRADLRSSMSLVIQHALATDREAIAVRVLVDLVQRGGAENTDFVAVYNTVPVHARTRLLCEVLPKAPKGAKLRNLLALALGNHQWQTAAPVLRTAMTLSPNTWVTPAFLSGLVLSLHGPGPVELMIQLSAVLRGQSSSSFHAAAWVEALAQGDDPRVEAELLAWLEDARDPLVIQICGMLERFGTAASLTKLRTYDSFLVNGRVRRASVSAVEAIESRLGGSGGLSLVQGEGRLTSSFKE